MTEGDKMHSGASLVKNLGAQEIVVEVDHEEEVLG